MDNEVFVQNIKDHCKSLGIPPTTACKNAGVGASFISDIKRGQTPSVSKVQTLANYLGVTTSELLGENEQALMDLFRRLTPDQQDMVTRIVQAAADKQ